MALSENKIIIPHKTNLEGDPGDVSTHRLSLLPYFLDIEGITDPSSWDWSVEIGKLFPERVEKNFFGLITKVIPAHYGLTAQDQSSSNHIYRPSGGVTFTGSGYPEFIINFGKLVPGEEYPINLIIKGKKLVGGNPIQKNFYEKLTFMMEKQKVASPNGWVAHVNPYAGAAAAATNQTGHVLMVEDGELLSVEVVGSKEGNVNATASATLTDVGLETLLSLNPNLSKTLVDTNEYGNDLDRRYYYTREEKDQYYNALVNSVYFFKENEFDAENNINATLDLDLRDYWANGGYLKYNHETFSNAGNVVDFNFLAFDRTRGDEAWHAPIQLEPTPNRSATKKAYVAQILWEQARGSGSSAISSQMNLVSHLKMDEAFSLLTIGAFAYQELTLQKAHALESPYIIERMSEYVPGGGTQTITVDPDRKLVPNAGWLINVESKSNMVIPGNAKFARISETMSYEFNALSGMMEKLNTNDINSFLKVCFRAGLRWNQSTSATYKLSTQVDPVTENYLLGDTGISSNFSLSDEIKEGVKNALPGSPNWKLDRKIKRNAAEGLRVTKDNVTSSRQMSLQNHEWLSFNMAPFLNDSIPHLSNRGFTLNELGFGLDKEGFLHEATLKMKLRVPQSEDSIRAELELNRLPQNLLEKVGMDWYYDNVLSEGLTVTLGVGYGKTSILGEDTEEGHKAQIQIKTPDTFFGFEYGKYHRDGGTQTELRSMYEKKLGNFHAGFDVLLFDADTEVFQSDGFQPQVGGWVSYPF